MEWCCLQCVMFPVLCYVIYRLLDAWYHRPMLEAPQSRHILVTGADTGFGNAIVKRLDAQGVPMIAGCLTQTGSEELKKSCSSRILTVRLNVLDKASIAAAKDAIKAHLPDGKGLWAVVNNAGVPAQAAGLTTWMDTEDYDSALGVNLYGMMDVTKAMLPLIKKEKGRVVNMSSAAGRWAAGGAPYTLSKYGVECYSDLLRRELMPIGVSVSIIEPGFVATNITSSDNQRRALEYAWNRLDKDTQDEYGPDFIDNCVKKSERMKGHLMSRTMDHVLDAYAHALLSRHPRARYFLAGWVALALCTLPEWIADSVYSYMNKYYSSG